MDRTQFEGLVGAFWPEERACPGEAPPTRDAIGGPELAVAFVTAAALAIFAWALESLISALAPATEGVTESDP